MDLDGQGGRMFLRVLLNLVMHNYPPLVSGALQLLFRHFSQRQEVLQAFKQVTTGMKRERYIHYWPLRSLNTNPFDVYRHVMLFSGVLVVIF